MSVVEEDGGESSRGEVGVLALTACCGSVAASPGCSYAMVTFCSRLSGDAKVPLAEKYSLLKSFRLMGCGAAVTGSPRGGETAKRRLGMILAFLEMRERHLGHTAVISRMLCRTILGCRSIGP